MEDFDDFGGFETDDLEVFNRNEAADYHEEVDFANDPEDDADGDVFYNDPDND